MEHEDLNEGRVANWFRHELLSCGLIWQRVEGICRRFGNGWQSKVFFFSFRLVCAWFSLLDGRVFFFFEDCLIWFVEIDCKIDWRQVKFMCYIYINPNLKDHKKDWRDLSITLKRFFFSFRQINDSITGRVLFFEELMWFDIVCGSRL